MRLPFNRSQLMTAGAVVLAGAVVVATGTRFSDDMPLPVSAGPTADESMPITFGNPAIAQWSIADRDTQLFALKPNAGAWDMNAVNETSKDKGRYLFTVFETGASGIQRHDLETGETDTIWQSWSGCPSTRVDPSIWTPWGTLIAGEENWGCGDDVCGRARGTMRRTSMRSARAATRLGSCGPVRADALTLPA